MFGDSKKLAAWKMTIKKCIFFVKKNLSKLADHAVASYYSWFYWFIFTPSDSLKPRGNKKVTHT